MQPRMLRHALQLFALLVLINSAVYAAADWNRHTCYFDEIHKNDQQDLPTVEPSPSSLSSSGTQYMHISFSTRDTNDKKKHCLDQGARVKSLQGITVYCQENDVLSAWKKRGLMQIVRSAITMHTERLKVKKLDANFKVPKLTGALCRKFTVPNEHTTTGVADADFMLYVASFPSIKKDMFAAGAPCARIDDGRPVVGALSYTTSRIDPSVYSVRVATHEIAHALGFTYKIMKSKLGGNVRGSYARFKGVEEVHSPLVKKFSKLQYDCGRSWGVELEDENGVLSVPSKSHWERRNVLEELMVGIVTAGYYTYLTLALFQDLGFYEADLSKAEVMDYGTLGGCDFLKHRCIENGYVDNSRYLCSAMFDEGRFCAPGRRAIGACSMTPRLDSPPKMYQYYWVYRGFWYDYYAASKELLTDRCPLYEDGWDISCMEADGVASGFRGPDSWCLKRRDHGSANRIIGGVCAHVTVKDNGDVYVQASKGSSATKCEKKDGRFYTATFEYEGATYTYDCPRMEEVKQDKKMEELIKKASQANESGIVPPNEYNWS